jgi:hypothetical protein
MGIITLFLVLVGGALAVGAVAVVIMMVLNERNKR